MSREACFCKKKVFTVFKEGWNSIQDENRSGKFKMATTSKIVNSVNPLILADRRVIIEGVSELQGISVGTAHKIVHDDLAFSKVSCCWVLPGQCKASYFSKNSGNHQAAATSFLQSKFSPFWFSLVCTHPQRTSAWNKVFKRWWSKDHRKQMA